MDAPDRDRWRRIEELADAALDLPPEGRPEWSRYFNVDYNHKVIGIQYGVSSLLILLIGGIFAIIFRIELAQTGMQWLNNTQFNTLFSAHGIIMIAAMLGGVGAMVNYLAPLMIGASDMAFPRLNAFSFWVSVPAALRPGRRVPRTAGRRPRS